MCAELAWDLTTKRKAWGVTLLSPAVLPPPPSDLIARCRDERSALLRRVVIACSQHSRARFPYLCSKLFRLFPLDLIPFVAARLLTAASVSGCPAHVTCISLSISCTCSTLANPPPWIPVRRGEVRHASNAARLKQGVQVVVD